jgi:hypothetical protein
MTVVAQQMYVHTDSLHSLPRLVAGSAPILPSNIVVHVAVIANAERGSGLVIYVTMQSLSLSLSLYYTCFGGRFTGPFIARRRINGVDTCVGVAGKRVSLLTECMTGLRRTERLLVLREDASDPTPAMFETLGNDAAIGTRYNDSWVLLFTGEPLSCSSVLDLASSSGLLMRSRHGCIVALAFSSRYQSARRRYWRS